MNKKLIYGFAALAGFGLASCEGDYDDWAAPQANEQEQIAAAYAVAFGKGAGSDVAMPAENNMIAIAKVSSDNKSISSYVLKSLKITEGETTFDMAAEIVDGDVLVSAQSLSLKLQELKGTRAKNTYNLTVATRVGAILTTGEAVEMSGTSEATFTTQELPAEDEKGYYILGDLEGNGWSLATPIEMTKEGNGIYKAIVTTKYEGGNWWKLYQGSHADKESWDETNLGQMGCFVNGCDDAKGFVVFPGDADAPNGVQTMVINGIDKWDIIFDAINMTYNVVKHVDALYYAGDANGWSHQPMAKTGDDFVGFYYVMVADNSNTWGYKICTAPNWDNPQYGADESGNIVLGGGNIQNCEKDGFYKISFNQQTLTVTLTPIETISLIGSAVNGDSSWGTDADMTYNATTKQWEITTDLTAGEYKFRANHDWALSWGGDDDALTSNNGSNRSIAEAGNYTITFAPNADGFGVATVKKN